MAYFCYSPSSLNIGPPWVYYLSNDVSVGNFISDMANLASTDIQNVDKRTTTRCDGS